MRDLIDDLVVRELGGVQVDEDQARFEVSPLAGDGDRLAFTTDGYVVSSSAVASSSRRTCPSPSSAGS